MSLLSRSQYRRLREARFVTRDVWTPGGAQGVCAPRGDRHAVLFGPKDAPELRVALPARLTRGTDVASDHALSALTTALKAVVREVSVDPGTVLVVANRLVVHGRSSLRVRNDCADRWLQRLYVTDSLWPMRHWQHGSRRLLQR